jgi:hypothetical protein
MQPPRAIPIHNIQRARIREHLETIDDTERIEEFFRFSCQNPEPFHHYEPDTLVTLKQAYGFTPCLAASQAALDVIRERKGDAYAFGLVGKRTPETLYERVKFYCFGSLPDAPHSIPSK